MLRKHFIEYNPPDGIEDKLILMDKYMVAKIKKANKADVSKMVNRIETLEKEMAKKKIEVKRA